MSLVVVDADVLGRRRTGDETYVRNILRALPAAAAGTGLRLAAVTRHPELVPEGIEPIALTGSSQELRMAWTLPRLLRRLDADLVHTQYALPLRCPCPAVVTIHDLSFEADATAMGARDRAVFRRVVPRAARAARVVLTVSERTRSDLVQRYRIPRERIMVSPNAVDPAFTRDGPRADEGPPYVLAVGAVQARKDQELALEAARSAGLALVVVGPVRDEADRRAAARGRGARGGLRRHRAPRSPLPRRGLPRAGVALRGVRPALVEAMACGTPVVAVDEPALVEVAGDAAVIVRPERPRRRDRTGARRPRRARRGGARAGARVLVGRRPRRSSSRPIGRLSVDEGLGRRRLARACRRGRPARACAARPGRRARRRRQPPGLGARRAAGRGARRRERAAAAPRRERQPRHRATTGELVVNATPDTLPHAGAVAALAQVLADELPRRDRRPCAGVARRHAAALPAPVPDRRRHDRPQDAAAQRARGVRPARPLRPRRSSDRARALRLDARRRFLLQRRDDARRARRLGCGLPSLRRGHRRAVPGDARGVGALVRPRRRWSSTRTPR